jgi:hypothetical protein
MGTCPATEVLAAVAVETEDLKPGRVVVVPQKLGDVATDTRTVRITATEDMVDRQELVFGLPTAFAGPTELLQSLFTHLALCLFSGGHRRGAPRRRPVVNATPVADAFAPIAVVAEHLIQVRGVTCSANRAVQDTRTLGQYFPVDGAVVLHMIDA